MEKVYLISTCIKKSKFSAEFHFKGYLKGERIESVKVINEVHFELHREYLLKLVNIKVKNSVLEGKVEKYKKLFN